VFAVRIELDVYIYSIGIVVVFFDSDGLDSLDTIVLAGDRANRLFERAELFDCAELADEFVVAFPGRVKGNVFAELVVATSDAEIAVGSDFEIPADTRCDCRFECNASAECFFGRRAGIDIRATTGCDTIGKARC
jgi:hypothetical protein